jgi:hypothetical protein
LVFGLWSLAFVPFRTRTVNGAKTKGQDQRPKSKDQKPTTKDPLTSFVAQRYQWIDFRGASCGNQASRKSHEGQ